MNTSDNNEYDDDDLPSIEDSEDMDDDDDGLLSNDEDCDISKTEDPENYSFSIDSFLDKSGSPVKSSTYTNERPNTTLKLFIPGSTEFDSLTESADSSVETINFCFAGLNRLETAANVSYEGLVQMVEDELKQLKGKTHFKFTVKKTMEQKIHTGGVTTLERFKNLKIKGVPLQTDSEDCLFTAVSVMLNGDQHLSVVLRYLTSLYLVENRHSYLAVKDRAFCSISPSYETACLECPQFGTFASAWTVRALCDVLRVPIRIVFPAFDQHTKRFSNILNKTFYPSQKSQDFRPLYILWIYESHIPMMDMWDCFNKYLPISSVEFLEENKKKENSPNKLNKSPVKVNKSPKFVKSKRPSFIIKPNFNKRKKERQELENNKRNKSDIGIAIGKGAATRPIELNDLTSSDSSSDDMETNGHIGRQNLVKKSEKSFAIRNSEKTFAHKTTTKPTPLKNTKTPQPSKITEIPTPVREKLPDIKLFSNFDHSKMSLSVCPSINQTENVDLDQFSRIVYPQTTEAESFKLLNMVHSNSSVQEIIISKNKLPRIFMYSEKVVNISKFCFDSNSVLMLCRHRIENVFISALCYNNRTTLKLTMGAVMIHWDHDIDTYTSFFSHINTKLNYNSQMVIFGCDDDEVIKTAVTKCYSKSSILTCLRSTKHNFIENYSRETDRDEVEDIAVQIFDAEGVIFTKDPKVSREKLDALNQYLKYYLANAGLKTWLEDKLEKMLLLKEKNRLNLWANDDISSLFKNLICEEDEDLIAPLINYVHNILLKSD